MSAGNGTRERALAEAAAAVADGTPIIGAGLAARHGRSDGWGRQLLREARRQHDGATAATAGPVAAPDAPAAADGTPAAAPDPAVPTPPRRPWIDTAVILVVALVAAAASYGHAVEVALPAGEPLWIARLFPLTADGLTLAALRRGRDGRRSLALALGVSVLANIGTAFPEHAAAAGPAVSAWPPIALYATHWLLHGRRADR